MVPGLWPQEYFEILVNVCKSILAAVFDYRPNKSYFVTYTLQFFQKHIGIGYDY